MQFFQPPRPAGTPPISSAMSRGRGLKVSLWTVLPLRSFMSILLPCRTPVTLQGVAKPYRGRWHIVTEGLENTDSGNNRVRQINLLCSKPELYPLSSMKNWSGGEREMQSISFAKIMRQKGIKPPPLCFVAKQNIGEVSLSDGGVRKYRQWRQQNSES